MTMVEFILARLDEREKAAVLMQSAPDITSGAPRALRSILQKMASKRGVDINDTLGKGADWMLRDVQAKRSIVRDHGPRLGQCCGKVHCQACGPSQPKDAFGNCPTLGRLAAIDQTHPDYGTWDA